jgi:hypothetical protein
MREIRFRAWDGSVIHKVCRLGMHGFSTDLWSSSPVTCDARSTNTLQLMQFTGLLDKNGKEIYEGDIVSEGDGLRTRGKIEYDEEHAYFCYRTTTGTITLYGFYGKVIGNIYETPGLIEVKP